jgi:hypothetical protein
MHGRRDLPENPPILLQIKIVSDEKSIFFIIYSIRE